MDDKRNALIDSGLVLAAVTAFLYCSSSAFTGGYLLELGLDNDVLDRNFQQVLYHGFLISLMPVLYVLMGYASCRFLYSHIVLPELNDVFRKSWRRKRFLLSLRNKWTGGRKDSEIEKREKKHSTTFAFFALAFFALLLSLAHFEGNGKLAAKVVREELENKSFKEHEMITVAIDGKPRKLLHLMCGARNCAGVDPETKTVTYFPQNGHSFALPATKLKVAASN